MQSCDQPYYYILNYNSYESNRILYLEKIFGEANSIKIATELKYNDWNELISHMESFEGNEYSIIEQNNYHFDIIEVTCKIPLLLNVYYTDPLAPKKEKIDKGDISIIELDENSSETLTFIKGIDEKEYIYNFNVLRINNLSPNITIIFDEDIQMQITQNGIYTKKLAKFISSITIKNMEISDSSKTRIITKFGYAIDKTFEKIENDIYIFSDDYRPENLFGYVFGNREDKLNYTNLYFKVESTDENVKFCYTSNLGAYINPSLHNCFNVGIRDSYTISLLNPYIMYKNYKIDNDALDYYISFMTENKEDNITITPKLTKYSTNNRNIEGYPNSIEISQNESTILTTPTNNAKYLFVQMELCTPNKLIKYEFKNAFNGSSLEKTGELKSNSKTFENIQNTNLDTLLVFEDKNNIEEKSKVFFKYVGTNDIYNPVINNLVITIDNKNGNQIFVSQPISGEKFNYTIYIDKKGYLLNQNYTLCSFAKESKFAHYSETFTSEDKKVAITIDFKKKELVGYEEYDGLILADNGKLMFLSNVFSGNANKKDEDEEDTSNNSTPTDTDGNKDNKNLAIIISISIIFFVIVLIAVFLIIRHYKRKNSNIEEKINKEKEMTLPMNEM